MQGQTLQERRIIQGAFVASLVLHLLAAAATWRVPLLPRWDGNAEAAADQIEVLLEPPAEAAAAVQAAEAAVDAARAEAQTPPEPERTLPTAFTSVPERQASDVPPEQADYLAMRHSLAADNVLGGDSNTPRADQEWVADQVQIDREDLSGVPGVAYVPPAAAAPTKTDRQPQDPQRRPQETSATGATGQDAVAPAGQEAQPGRRQQQPRSGLQEPAGAQDPWMQGQEQGAADPQDGVDDATQQEQAAREQGRQAEQESAPQPLPQWWPQQSPTILREGDGAAGDRGFDFNQAAMGKVASGVAIDGDFSLNTYEWDYAPWMQWFTNELYRHWVPPYAYRLGILDGHTVIKLVVGKDGRVQGMDVIRTEGHESLHEASVAALRAFAPYSPLPARFPEENLVITLGLYYPAPRR